MKHSDADLALRTRAPAVRLADYQRTKLRRTTTVEEHRAQIADYDRTHGNILGTEQRGYPLTPGTDDSGTGECMDCGYRRHRGEDCTRPKLSFKERDYRRMAGAIAWEIRRGGGDAGGGRGGAAASGVPPNLNQAAANIFLLLSQAANAIQAQQGGDSDHGAHIEEVRPGNGDGVGE